MLRAKATREWKKSVPRCRAFTVIEIILVLLVLGILAALVVPQFSSASHADRENTLKDDLRYLRMQIIVYKAQHKDLPPGYQNRQIATAPDLLFLRQMTGATDIAGNVGSSRSATYQFGPYIQYMPTNPLNSNASLKLVYGIPFVADGSSGWLYNPLTQDIASNSIGKDAEGTPYVQY